MHEEVAFLKRAVARDTLGLLNCYHIKDGQIMARDLSLQAGMPFPSLVTDDFNIPAKTLEAVLGRAKQIELTHAGHTATVKGKRLKVDISCVEGEPPAVMLPLEGWKPVPKGFQAALKLVMPFILDKMNNYGIRLMDDTVTAISARNGIEVRLPGLDAEVCCMGMACAEFLLAQDDDPLEYHQTENSIAFKWRGERWVNAQLLQRAFPNADRVFTQAGSNCPVVISDEWRDAYGDMSALAEDVVQMLPNKLIAVRDTHKVESDIETAIPQGTESFWSTRGLDPVIAIAKSWNPAAWPAAAAFQGPNFRGVVVGASAS